MVLKCFLRLEVISRIISEMGCYVRGLRLEFRFLCFCVKFFII